MRFVVLLSLLCLALPATQPNFGYELFEDHGAIMLLIDPDGGKIIDANRAAAAFYGYDRTALRQLTVQDLNTLSPEQVRTEWQRAAAEDRNYFRFRHRTADGNTREVEVFSWPVNYGQKEVLFSIIQDVTDRKVAEEAVVHYSRQLEDLVDERTDELMAQERHFQLFLWGAIGLQALVIAGLIYNIRRRKRAEGALKATLADQSRQIEKAVEKSRHQADVIADQQRHQALSELLINLAHQWRQPLNAAGVLIQDIEDAYLAGELNETIIRRQSALAFSQLKSLSKTLDRFTALYEDPGQKEQLSLIALYHEARELMALRLKAQGVQIQGEIDPGHTVCMARRDLLEVLIKLITNAIETAQKRHLTQLKIVIESKQAENLTTIVLTDSAGGIEPEALSKLFDPYHTTGFKERSRGLSLYLIRRMIERRYEGSITAENSDKGARITLTLPSRCGN